ncbi:MAG TPA: polysaccharide biosynthesis/export family protein [Candidatus Sulfopaludibacter sp.]|nr:polysaccharide biosynthesis/export family protein [Candidatus Sulfopaludibacter sp.]
MRTAILAASLAFAAVVWAQPQQEQKPAQQAPPPGPASMSPMIPTGAPATEAHGSKQPVPAPINARTYIIGAEDVVAVHVFENANFSVPSEVVRPDGKITMPLLGEITASNKTPEELADEIQKVLVERYMKEPPHVQVIVLDVRSKNYYLQGEVNKPGKYPLVVPTTIMQALVNAGGFRDFANKKDIRIQRVGQDKFLKFNYAEVSKGKHLEQNILLQPDDQIYVH